MPADRHTQKKARKADPVALLKHDFEHLVSIGSPVPEDYAYLPKGDMYMTRHCRDLTAKSGQTLYIVYEPKTNERLGLRCPEAIFDEITAQAALTAKTRQAAVRAKDVKNLEAARKAMLRLFPRMPPNIVKRVLDRGYEKGSRRVGRTTKLDDDEKVTLAVTAYARHNHTNYDEQIQEFRRRGEWVAAKPQARAAIFLQLEGILSHWRAERTPRPLAGIRVPTRALKSLESSTKSAPNDGKLKSKREKQRARLGELKRKKAKRSAIEAKSTMSRVTERTIHLKPQLSKRKRRMAAKNLALAKPQRVEAQAASPEVSSPARRTSGTRKAADFAK